MNPTKEQCKDCNREFKFFEFRDDSGSIVDTAGGMRFEDGPVCDHCLGGSAHSDSEIALAKRYGR